MLFVVLELDHMHSLGRAAVAEIAAITLERLQAFSHRSSTLITIDAPLFGSVMVMNGRLLNKGQSYVRTEKIGQTLGFPSFEHIVAEATRFWVQNDTGFRTRKTREEMAKLLDGI
jgi:hypothetical protein